MFALLTGTRKSRASSGRFELKPGRVVRVHGLKTATEFNGTQGELVDFDEGLGRWVVAFGEDQKKLKVPPREAAGGKCSS